MRDEDYDKVEGSGIVVIQAKSEWRKKDKRYSIEVKLLSPRYALTPTLSLSLPPLSLLFCLFPLCPSFEPLLLPQCLFLPTPFPRRFPSTFGFPAFQ